MSSTRQVCDRPANASSFLGRCHQGLAAFLAMIGGPLAASDEVPRAERSAELCLLLDRQAVADVVQTERAARDQAQWERMLACYHPDSTVSLSWFEGTGPEFVAASKQVYEREGARAFHLMGPTVVRVRGDRSLAESGCAIVVASRVAGREVTVVAFARFHARLTRRDGAWRLTRMRAVYQHDLMVPGDPASPPAIAAERLAAHRPSYRHLAYILNEAGRSAWPGVAGMDRPEHVQSLSAEDDAWLER